MISPMPSYSLSKIWTGDVSVLSHLPEVHRQGKRIGTSSVCFLLLLHPPLIIQIKGVCSPGVCKKQKKCLLKGTSLKTMCRGRPGSPEFHLQGKRGTWSAWRLQVLQLLLEAGGTSDFPLGHWTAVWHPLYILFNREAVLGTNNSAISFYCQIAR